MGNLNSMHVKMTMYTMYMMMYTMLYLMMYMMLYTWFPNTDQIQIDSIKNGSQHNLSNFLRPAVLVISSNSEIVKLKLISLMLKHLQKISNKINKLRIDFKILLRDSFLLSC